MRQVNKKAVTNVARILNYCTKKLDKMSRKLPFFICTPCFSHHAICTMTNNCSWKPEIQDVQIHWNQRCISRRNFGLASFKQPGWPNISFWKVFFFSKLTLTENIENGGLAKIKSFLPPRAQFLLVLWKNQPKSGSEIHTRETEKLKKSILYPFGGNVRWEITSLCYFMGSKKTTLVIWKTSSKKLQNNLRKKGCCIARRAWSSYRIEWHHLWQQPKPW